MASSFLFAGPLFAAVLIFPIGLVFVRRLSLQKPADALWENLRLWMRRRCLKRNQLQTGIKAYEEKDYPVALKALTPLAQLGTAEAQYYLGRMYDEGSGVPKDDQTAEQWYQMAAAQGLATAQYLLGYRNTLGYDHDPHLPLDYKAAVEWYRKAAEKGHTEAQARLGEMYQYGYGVPRDYAEALKWYYRAADQNSVSAMKAIGFMYYWGEGVPQDYVKHAEWYRKAAEQGDASAQYILAGIYADGDGVPQDYKEAAKWYESAAQRGNHLAQCRLGAMYEQGTGVTQDYEQARSWYRKAAELGVARAQNNLGAMYATGRGVLKDYVIAYALQNVASASPDSTFADHAAKLRDLLEMKMPPDAIYEAQSISRRMATSPAMIGEIIDKHIRNGE